ncbi:MAG: type II toxin-antitoxin system prevent-host-death family antitoxin [Solimonas sp.]
MPFVKIRLLKLSEFIGKLPARAGAQGLGGFAGRQHGKVARLAGAVNLARLHVKSGYNRPVIVGGASMTEVGTLEAKNRLSSLLDEVLDGGEVIITRHGKPVAKLVAINEKAARAQEMRAVIEATRRLHDSIKPKGKPIPWEELKNAGRKW